MKAIIYCRVSTKDQANEGMSLQNQEVSCVNYAESLGYEVVKKFIEEGESAKTKMRTQLISLLDYCSDHKGEIDALIVWKIDRFCRSTEDHFALRAMLSKYGVKILSVTEPISDTSQGRMLEGVLAVFAQFDNDVRTDRVNIGMMQKAQKGRWVFGRIPLGYMAEKDDKDKTILVINKAKGEIIKRAFIEFSTGIYLQSEIQRMVNGLGLRSNNNAKLSSQSINNMLRNPIYAGYVPNPWENKIEKGIHEPIISKELFDTCQAIIKGYRPSQTPRHKYNPDFPLRGLLRCEKCGKPLTGSKSKGKTKRYGYYHCYKCSGVNYRSDETNKQFIELLGKIKPTKEYAKDFREIFLSEWKTKYQDLTKDRKKISHELVELEDKKDKIIDMAAYNKLTDSDYDKKMNRLNAEILQKNSELSKIKVEEYDVEALLNYAEWFLVRTDKIWKGLAPDLQQKFQQFIFPEGLPYNEKGFIGTPVLSPVYAVFNASASDKSTMVVPRGVEPLLPG